MSLRGLFKRRPRPSTEGLQSVAEKYVDDPREMVFPLYDKNGRLILDRPKVWDADYIAENFTTSPPKKTDR